MSDQSDPVWSLAEQLANRLQVIEILTSLFPRLNLGAELEACEISALMNHLNELVSDAHREALAIMKRDRDRCHHR
ncbi:MAG: hypothetical protein Q8S32_13150 [Burkholderiaceae bacterium]|nr:hypothetical protein [Burkholderiaceae bacterium]